MFVKDGEVAIKILVEGGFMGQANNGADPSVSEGKMQDNSKVLFSRC